MDNLGIQALLRNQWRSIYDVQYWPRIRGEIDMMDLRIQDVDGEFLMAEITMNELNSAIKDLHAGTSAGVSDIPPRNS